ncbi:spherulation-specific family 4 protein [Streptomyces sp. NPDC021224]|uniref:spherulation-specific family 4 protein n=1 Tax=unclassified Streptomyces TaxID=2593676 RepID=UPI00379C679E
MPRVTKAPRTTGTGTGLAVPGLVHPLMAPAEWAELARPGADLRWAAFDVSRGPGSRPDPLYAEVTARVRENGVPLLGTLDAAYGDRPFGELVSDASRYLDWYQVDGFYLDRAPTARDHAADCHWAVTTLRALLGREPAGGAARSAGAGPVVLGHGVHPHPRYAEIADQLVTFAGPWDRYRWSEAPQWTAAHPPSTFVHLVHSVPGLHLDGALRIARWQGAATVCLTDRGDRGGTDPWSGLPGYWDRLVRAVGGAEAGPASAAGSGPGGGGGADRPPPTM